MVDSKIKCKIFLKKCRLRFLVALSIIFFVSQAFAEEDCLSCHGEGGEAKAIPSETYPDSIHGREGLACSDCHSLIPGKDHTKEDGILLPVDCTECHDKENHHGKDSLDKNRPLCHDCHTKHSIKKGEHPESSIHLNNLKITCQKCHPTLFKQGNSSSWMVSLRITTHGKQDFSKEYRSDNCLGCHQGTAVHGKNEKITDENCATCHIRETGKMFGTFHNSLKERKQPVRLIFSLFNQILLLALVIGGIIFCVHLNANKRKGRGEE